MKSLFNIQIQEPQQTTSHATSCQPKQSPTENTIGPPHSCLNHCSARQATACMCTWACSQLKMERTYSMTQKDTPACHKLADTSSEACWNTQELYQLWCRLRLTAIKGWSRDTKRQSI